MNSDNANTLSGSTNGRPIAIAATMTPGTLIHQSLNQSGINIGHQIYLSATNLDSADHVLTIQFGGTSTSDEILIKVPAGTQVQNILNGDNFINNGVIVRAFADSANKINVYGMINIYSRPNSKQT